MIRTRHMIRARRLFAELPFVLTTIALGAGALLCGSACAGEAEEQPMPTASNPFPATHTKTKYTFGPITTKAEWLARQKDIREHILVSAGLWPEPPKCALKPERLDRKAFDGYVREKVYFQSFPGVLVTGALYWPAEAKGKLPAVLCPHGHWKHGRLEEPPQARCINLARQGYVVLAIDMVGYNDNGPIPHGFKGDMLWELSLGGLQLWNCIRSLDFLQTLDRVDPKRIGVTGASGGGTQTFMVSAVDDRVKVAAPVCMISAHFQGGCLCENAPLMRVMMNNMEIGAAMAPRPLVLVSATGDWTKNNPTVEYPAIRKIYELLGAGDKIAEKQFNLGHNYDQPGREVVYSWFARWLKGAPAGTEVKETPYEVDNELLIFGKDRPRPDWVKSPEQFVEEWRRMAGKQLDEYRPKDAAGLKRFRDVFGTELHQTLCLAPDVADQLDGAPGKKTEPDSDGVVKGTIKLGLKGRATWLKGTIWTRQQVQKPRRLVVVAHPKGTEGLSESFVRELTKTYQAVLAIDCLPMGQRKRTKDAFYYTYNRSNLAVRVQEIVLALAMLSSECRGGKGQVDLIGLDQAGLWAVLARGAADLPGLGATVVDACGFDGSAEASWDKNEMFNPGMMRLGGLDTAGGLIAPSRLLIHNTGGAYATKATEAAYRSAEARKSLRLSRDKLDESAMLSWLSQ
ncbi:MAG: acetylxylan esterase [Phycisphaerae bacterium]|nr:acetylxylan esterase [Phycisphaerae bacterium]